MTSTRLPVLSLLSLLWFAPAVHAAKPAAPVVVATPATQLDLEVAELGKDGVRRATTLTLSLPDHNGRGGLGAAELKTRVPGERGEAAEYTAKVHPEATSAGTRYYIELERRMGQEPSKGFDMRIEVVRLLKLATPVQIGRVVRPDGSSMIVTATVR